MEEFFARLKEHKLVQWALGYAAVALALIPVMDVIAAQFGWPESLRRSVTLLLIMGFFVVVVLAWYHGERGEQKMPRSEMFALAGLIIIAAVLVWRVAPRTHEVAAATSSADAVDAQTIAATLAKLPHQSVAVLPLSNESGDPKQQYFTDGLSEELISDLTQIDGLKVIGKYSSFKFRDSKDSPAQIGAALGVAHLILGSVRQQGDRIRATVGMIRAVDGSSVWSHTYDGQLKDVFAIQSQIGQAVASALQVKLLGKAIVSNDKPPSGNVEAYKLMLQGRALVRHGTEADIRQGIALYQQALKLDPDYAFAWGTLSNAWVNLGFQGYVTGDALQQAYAQARVAVDRARALAPDAAQTHLDHGVLLANVDNDPAGALAELKRAHALAPHDGSVIGGLANGLATIGQLQPSVELFRRAIATDPLRTDFYANLASVLLAQGQLDAAEQATRKALVLQPDFPGLYLRLAQIAILRGDAAAALRHAGEVTDPVDESWVRAMARQVGPDRKRADAALRDYIVEYGNAQPYFVAELYALRKQPDDMFEWLQRALTQNDPSLINSLLVDPFVLAYQHDPRFAALCKQAGLSPPEQMASVGG